MNFYLSPLSFKTSKQVILFVLCIVQCLVCYGAELNLTPEEKSYLNQNPVVSIGLSNNSISAYQYGDEINGFPKNILDMISLKTGINFKIYLNSQQENFKQFQLGKINILADLLYTPSRESYALFSHPYLSLPVMFFSRKGIDISDLSHFKIGVSKSIQNLHKLDISNVTYYDNQQQQMQDLADGKVDVAIQTLQAGNYYIKKLKLNNVVISHQFNNEFENLHFGIRKELPILHAIFNKALDAIDGNKRKKTTDIDTNVASVRLTPDEQLFIQQHPVITLGSEKTWEPAVIQNDDGTITGLDADILENINQLTGSNFRLTLGSWRQMQQLAKEKKIDGLSTSAIFPERKEYLNFSDIYLAIEKRVLVKMGNPEKIYNREDLAGKTIVIHRGNLTDEKLSKEFPDSTIIYADTVEDVLKEVIIGKGDAMFGNLSTAYLANKLNMPYLSYAFMVGQRLELAFGIRKDWPLAISILNKGLKAIGPVKMNLIQQKWISFHQEPLPQQKETTLSREQREYLKQKKQIRLCIDNDWLPFEQYKNDRYEGILADIHLLINKNLQLNTEIIYTENWAQSLDYLKTHRCDVLSGATSTSQRKQYMDFTQTLFSFPLVIIGLKNQTYIGDIQKIIDKPFAVIKGYAAIELLKRHYPQINIIEVENIREGLRQLKSGKVFGFIESGARMSYFTLKNAEQEVKVIAQLDQEYHLAVATRKDQPILNSIYNHAIQSISQHEKDQIVNRWLFKAEEASINQTVFNQLIAAFVVVFLILIGWFKYRERQKSREHKGILMHYSKLSSIGEMVGNIAHQWRQPLTEIGAKLMYLDTRLRLKHEITTQDLELFVYQNHQILEHMGNTIDTFMNFYKTGQVKQNFSLKQAIENTLLIFDGSFLKEHIIVHKQLQDISYYGSSGDFTQVLLAILSNARNEAINNSGNRQIWIDLSYNHEHTEIKLTIKDNFGGIKLNPDKIFNLNVSSNPDRTGIGLYLANKLITQSFNGSITATNYKNNNDIGAIFSICLKVSEKS